jgi:hypothetical protein
MNPTDKMEMQVAEEQDGSAVIQLPAGEQSPQQENPPAEPIQEAAASDDGDDGDDVDQGGNDDEREAIREARREERKLKKQIHREKARESNHLISALKKQNSELAERLAIIEKKTSGAELARVDKAIEDAGVQVEYAKMQMQEAVSAGDGVALTRAQEMWFDAKRKMESLTNVKQQATRQMSQPKQNIQAPDPMVQRLAADWMERNPWYDPNGRNEDSQIAQIIDKKLTEEGFDPSSEDYWDELDERMKKRMPEMQNRAYNDSHVRNQRPRSVVTSSGREATATTKSNEFRLTPDRVAAMKEAGLWDNIELRKKAINNYVNWDRANKSRTS